MPRHLQNEIHSDFSSNFSDWNQYRAEIKTLFDASNSKDDFNDHLIREFNRKIKSLKVTDNLIIEPYDAGYRFTGSNIPSVNILVLNTPNQLSDFPTIGGNVTKVGDDILIDSRSSLNTMYINAYSEADLVDVSNTNISSFGSSYCYIDNINASRCENLTSITVGYFYTLTSIDASQCPNLMSLYCPFSALSSLNLSGSTNITNLNVLGNMLSEIDVSDLNQLIIFECLRNPLITLDVYSNPNLEILRCYENQLTTLDISNNLNLQVLECNNNELIALDISNNLNLQTLNCKYNYLTTLNVSYKTNLGLLECSNNQISQLDLNGCINLISLNCSYNSLVYNIDIGSCPNLQYLNCNNNQFLEEYINNILIALNSFNTSYGYCNLSSGSNASPTGPALSAITDLQARGWIVYTN